MWGSNDTRNRWTPFSEIAPPPEDVKYSNLKTDEVRIGWSLPELHNLYSINGYSLEYRTFAAKQWEMFDTVRGTNRRLDGLEPGVAYMVRLKSNNPYGVSEPSRMLEFKTPEGMYRICHVFLL